MRRAKQPRPAKSTRSPADRLSIVVADPDDFAEDAISTTDAGVEEVLLSPAGTFAGGVSTKRDRRDDRRRELAIAIRQRIESRLQGRVRRLVVRILGNRVVLEGECSTYYTKQLAQHTALGVLENEQLENEIVVCVPR
jgi:hypothetical protein